MSKKDLAALPTAEALREVLRDDREAEDTAAEGRGLLLDISKFGKPEQLGYRFSDYARERLRAYANTRQLPSYSND